MWRASVANAWADGTRHDRYVHSATAGEWSNGKLLPWQCSEGRHFVTQTFVHFSFVLRAPAWLLALFFQCIQRLLYDFQKIAFASKVYVSYSQKSKLNKGFSTAAVKITRFQTVQIAAK